MTNPRLASRYAKSLIDLSLERGSLEATFEDMQFFQQVIKGNPDFATLLRSPIVTGDTKLKIIEAVTAGRVGEITTLFVRLLVQKGRESALPEIATAFINQYKITKGIQVVTLTTATAVSEEVKSKIIDQVKATSDFKNIELLTKVDESLIGGFVLQAGDKLVDASISYDLRQVTKQFENNDFIYKII
ncbi:MAG: ATP synthase F1 subunit delta [Chitinophagaceae bacterium]